MAKKSYDNYLKAIRKFIPKDRVLTGQLLRLAWGTDAGFYRLVPKVVVLAQTEEEVSRLVKCASSMDLPVTFRAAGTSLSGQAISDSILIVAGKGWEDYKVLDNGNAITMQPGIIGSRVSEILLPYKRIFTPDPASKGSAMVGGIVMNNASGMNCGTHANSDKMLLSMRIVLADGTIIDTGRPSGSEREKELLKAISDIRDEIRKDKELVERIERKYSIKNVTGLNLRPFVAYDDPMQILAHVMVGSEGTLGFMSQVTMLTGALLPFTASAMVYFKSMEEACRAVVALKKSHPEVYSCELLDKKSLASVHDSTGEGLTALLIETRAENESALVDNIASISGGLDAFDTYLPPTFTSDTQEVAALWRMRSGVFPAVGGTRPLGTTSLIEDIAFPIDRLPEATLDMAKLIEDCGYDDACIYGHAFEGNYHFVIAQAFESQKDLDKYRHLIEEVVSLVVDKYDGSLKAEHGTGRNMAPFVKKEWGDKAYSIMLKVKHIFDPQGILNPGVIFNADPMCYLKNLKPLHLANDIIDRCIECGFCEVNCVSCGFTISARQRIVATREMAYLKSTDPESATLQAIKKEYKYLGDETCAADGLCSLSCPMSINTGDLTHQIRQENLQEGSVGRKIGKYAAEHLSGIESGLRPVLGLASLAHGILGDKATNALGKGLHSMGLPLWTASLPTPFKLKKTKEAENAGSRSKIVYFPSCINQTMGPSKQSGKTKLKPLVEVMTELCNRAGFDVIYPENMSNLCCGMIWESKGMPDIADQKTSELEQALLKASDGGKYPILCDQSPCLHRMREHIKGLKLYEPAELIHDILSPHLVFKPIDGPVAVHITCSTRRMGLADKIVALAGMCCRNVFVPAEVGCCGFAGDKGFTHPELNKWALRKLRPQLEEKGIAVGYSNSRTCEIGLTTNSGIPYQSIAYLVEETTR